MTSLSNQVPSSFMASKVIIDSITCPISGLPMKNPVQGNDGHTYEKEFIVKWLTDHRETSPMTNEPMKIADLKVNANIRYLCDEYHSGKFGNIPKQKPKIINNINYGIDSCVKYNVQDKRHMFTFSTNCDTIDFNDLPGIDLVIVQDRSGSTGMEVTAQDTEGKLIEVGLSINDIVNHAAKTVASALRDKDRLSIYAFDDRVECIQSLQPMNNINKSAVLGKIEQIKPRGSTNIFGGIKQALDMIEQRQDKTRQTAIIALTDGQPNISPARGEIKTLRSLRESTGFSTPIYMMGFGYDLKRGLLYEMSKEGNGSTAHIPDGGMVGTVFSNYLATILCTSCTNLVLKISPTDRKYNMNYVKIIGDYSTNVEDNNLYINLGVLQFKQNRNIIIEGLPDQFDYEYTYNISGKNSSSNKFNVDNSDLEIQVNNTDIDYLYNYTRSNVADKLRIAISYKMSRMSTVELYNNLVSSICSLDLERDNRLKYLLETLKDQVYLILGEDNTTSHNYYNKWGEFYLDQLSNALLKEYTPNFKDQACKVFGGDLFEKTVDHIADIYDQLPPPKPSIKKYDYSTGSYRSLGVSSMATFNNASAGCWTGDSIILLPGGKSKRADEIKPGDRVATLSDHNDASGLTYTTVKTVVITEQDSNEIEITELPGGGKLTNWHPFLGENNVWSFPVEKYPEYVSKYKCNRLYNLVLETKHVVIVNGIPCITLGHCYDNGILKHPYFGSKKIIEDLMSRPDYNTGTVILKSSDFNRDGPILFGGLDSVSGMMPSLIDSNESPTLSFV